LAMKRVFHELVMQLSVFYAVLNMARLSRLLSEKDVTERWLLGGLNTSKRGETPMMVDLSNLFQGLQKRVSEAAVTSRHRLILKMKKLLLK
ncbi:MAG: hypothetical protein QF566_04215, partial [Candidatus Thalassarchaeaceae archaeon]|nr:hypothetical protein [Candidatus Thalassarchaeaceae archaeon]